MKIWSRLWNRSSDTRKQRKFRYNAPLHIKQKFMHVHLSPELKEKYGTKNIGIRVGDKVKVLRGQFRKRTGRVNKVSLVYEKVYIEGVELVKKEGAKVFYPVTASNLMITDLNLEDKRRRAKIEKNVKKEKK
ncbi:50S ribosomal protein L24 [archaeon]|jgi:large subunit ribosomal protein L24|nr:50S ribosomal protein L24 [archaeon]MBT4416750.1 50S ribosomal protein L24 [archaeon]